jgi:hypothetical protein
MEVFVCFFMQGFGPVSPHLPISGHPHVPQFSTTTNINLTTSSKNNFKVSKVKTYIQLSIFQSLNPFKMSQPTEVTTPEAFPYFSDPRFPAEIKDLIWSFAIDAIPPRTVDITSNPKSPPNQYSWISTAPLSALLHTCSRSRSLTQKSYPLSFTSKTTANNGTYFNFQKDTLYFAHEFMFSTDFVQDVGEEERGKVKKLAFGLGHQTEREEGGFLVYEEVDEDSWGELDVVELLFEFWPGLESVGFVDQYTGYLKELGWKYGDPEDGEEVADGGEDEGEEEDEDEDEGPDEDEDAEEEIDIEAWKWWPKEYHVLVNGIYTVGGMTEEMLLGGFEERCEKLGFKVLETRYLEVRKVVKKQVKGELVSKIPF